MTIKWHTEKYDGIRASRGTASAHERCDNSFVVAKLFVDGPGGLGCPEVMFSLGAKILKNVRNEVFAMSLGQKMDAARHEDTPVGMLAVLSEDENQGIRSFVARNENTSAEVLAALAGDIVVALQTMKTSL